MTTPDIDDWDQPTDGYTGPERRQLDRTERAYVRHANGAFQVVAGFTSTAPTTYDNAVRDMAVHNAANNFSWNPAELRKGA